MLLTAARVGVESMFLGGCQGAKTMSEKVTLNWYSAGL